MHYFSDLFGKVLYMFRTGPMSIIRSISTLNMQQVFVMLVLLASASVVLAYCEYTVLRYSDDGHWTCPKHVEYFTT